MLDLMPGIEITLYLVSWVVTTVVALALWDWATDTQGDEQ